MPITLLGKQAGKAPDPKRKGEKFWFLKRKKPDRFMGVDCEGSRLCLFNDGAIMPLPSRIPGMSSFVSWFQTTTNSIPPLKGFVLLLELFHAKQRTLFDEADLYGIPVVGSLCYFWLKGTWEHMISCSSPVTEHKTHIGAIV